MTSPADDRVPWYRPSGADVVFVFMMVLIFQGARNTMLDDPGLGWHLRNIDAMLAEGWWLTRDPFTYPHDGKVKEWRTNQWLGEVPLWLGWQWAGEEGIAAVVSLVLAFMLRCLYRMLLRDGIAWPPVVVWTGLAALGTQVSWVARPNVFTMLFLLWTARVCDLFHQGRCSRRFTLWLVPLFAVWANTHGGFLAGLITLGATLAIEGGLALGAIDVEARRPAQRRALHLGVLLAACALATLVNPYGYTLYPWVLKLLGNPFFMNLNHEWKPPPFGDTGSFRFELLMLLYPVMLALSRRRPNLIELGLGVVWLHFAFNGFRYVALWVLVAIPTMARCSLAIPWLESAAVRFGLSGSSSRLFKARMGPAGWGWSVVVAALFFGLSRTAEGKFARHNPKFIPAAALSRLLELHRERPQARIFHAYNWGGYLTWHGWNPTWPSFLNWLDDRNEVQGQGHIEQWNSIVAAEPGWEKKLDEADVEIIALQPDAPVVALLKKDLFWGRPYENAHAIIFARALTPRPALGPKRRFK